MAISLSLIGGYLGTGKTTLINQLIRSPDAEAIAVVVNDFGDVNIDAELIAASGADTVELTNGCICCQISDDVQRTMAALAVRDDIEHVICEVSGVGDPAQLGSWRTYPGFRPGPVIVCVDALVTDRRLADEYIADVVHNQIAAADLLLITKTDLASASQIESTRRACVRINPTAQVRESGELTPSELLELITQRQPAAAPSDSSHTAQPDHAQAHQTATVHLPRPIDLARLRAVLERSSSRLMRAKGFIRDEAGDWHEVHLAGGMVSAAPVPPGRPAQKQPELVLIASGPDAGVTLEDISEQLRRI